MKITSTRLQPQRDELAYVMKAITSGEIASDGTFTRACARLLEQRFGIHKVLMTPSCTAALEIAAALCDLGPGDEVILPSFTFVSTANAFVRLGARPVFVDIRPDTLNLDEQLIEAHITSRTRAIFPVHYGGVGCRMDRIMAIAQKYRLQVVEDAAQAVNASFKGQALGTIGQLGAFSFHHTKNVSCGEGGALLINSPKLAERAEIIRDKGTNRGKFLRGEVDRYTWVDIGSSQVPSEISCAYLLGQLERMERITEQRRQVAEFYNRSLRPLAEQGLLQLPVVPAGCRTNNHIYYVVLPDVTDRDNLMAYLQRNGIAAVPHYVPLHTSPMGRKFGYRTGDLPVTESLSERLLRLPVTASSSVGELTAVVRHISLYLLGKWRGEAAPELLLNGAYSPDQTRGAYGSL